jgi:hypothetical protein
MLDELRAAYPALGFSLFAMEPGEPVTLEIYTPDGQVYSFTGATVAAAIQRAFPKPVVQPPAAQYKEPAPDFAAKRKEAAALLPQVLLDEPKETKQKEPSVFD